METHPVMSPPAAELPTPWNWARKNLFSTWYNSILTVICLIVSFQIIKGIIVWATTKAQWRVLAANLPLFFAGRFPSESYWRLWVIAAIISVLGGLTWPDISLLHFRNYRRARSQLSRRKTNQPQNYELDSRLLGAFISSHLVVD